MKSALLGLLICLAATVLAHRFRPPAPSVQGYVQFVPAANAVVWPFQDGAKRQQVCKLDLSSGAVQTVPKNSLFGQVNSRQQRFHFDDGVSVHDAETGKLLWQNRHLTGYDLLVGDHYLLGVDLRKVADIGDALNRPDAATSSMDRPRLLKISDADQLFPWDELLRSPIPGTNRFLCMFGKVRRYTFFVYEVQADQVVLIKSWPCGGHPIMRDAGCIYTPTPSGQEVEVRSLSDFELIQTRKLPPGLTDWSDVQNDHALFSFTSTQSGLSRIYALKDFELVTQRDLQFVYPLAARPASDQRFHILRDLQSYPTKLVVLDAEAKRIVYEGDFPRSHLATSVVDGQLVLVTSNWGLSVDFIDLASGKVLKSYRPFALSLVAMPLVGLLGLAWFVASYQRSVKVRRWSLLEATSIALLSLMPLLWHVSVTHSTHYMQRPLLGFVMAALFGIIYQVILFTVFGQRATLFRFAILWGTLAGIVVLMQWFHGESRYSQNGVNQVARMQLCFALGGLLLFYGVRLLGPAGFRRLGVVIRYPENSPVAKPISLQEIFWLTVSVALFLTALRTLGWVRWSSDRGGLLVTVFLFLFATTAQS